MNPHFFKLNTKIVWVLAIVTVIISFYSILANLQDWEVPQLISSISNPIYFSAWIICLGDMAQSKLYNKVFWIISLCILPTITPLIYLIQRNRLLRLGRRLS